MRFLRKYRPSPALVVASIGLLVALGGTSVAAVSERPLRSVGTPQLKGNAVTSPKVLNRSLLAVDFKQGQMPQRPEGPEQACQGRKARPARRVRPERQGRPVPGRPAQREPSRD